MTSKSRSFDGIIVDPNSGITDEQAAAIVSNTNTITALSESINSLIPTLIREDNSDQTKLGGFIANYLGITNANYSLTKDVDNNFVFTIPTGEKYIFKIGTDQIIELSNTGFNTANTNISYKISGTDIQNKFLDKTSGGVVSGNTSFTSNVSLYGSNNVILNATSDIEKWTMAFGAIVAGTNVEYCNSKGCVFNNGNQTLTLNGSMRVNNNLIVDRKYEFYSAKTTAIPSGGAGWYSIAILDDNAPNIIEGEDQQQRGTTKILISDALTHSYIEVEVTSVMALGIDHIKLLNSSGKGPFFYGVQQFRLLRGDNHGDGAILQAYFVNPSSVLSIYTLPDYQSSGWVLVQPTTSISTFVDYNGISRGITATLTDRKTLHLLNPLDLLNGGASFPSNVLIEGDVISNSITTILDEITAPTNWVNLTMYSGGLVSGYSNGSIIYYYPARIHKDKNLVRLSGSIYNTSGNFSNNQILSVIPAIYQPQTNKNFTVSSIDGTILSCYINGTNDGSTNITLSLRGSHNTDTIVLDQISYFID